MFNKTYILYRDTDQYFEEDELIHIKKYFNCTNSRTNIPNNSLVIGRYSVLPFYKELENDLANRKCKLINTTKNTPMLQI